MRKPSGTLIALVIALLLVSAGTGVAASKYRITSSKQVKAGSISLSDLSKSARRALRGNRGPAGAAGAQGAPGSTGARGPSDAWVISQLGSATGVTLPPGRYVLTGDVSFETGGSMQCIAWHNTTGGGAAGKPSNATGSGITAWSLPVSDVFETTETGKAWVDCTGGGAGGVAPNVAVIQVATLH